MNDLAKGGTATDPGGSPYYEALHATRYDRQALIRDYGKKYECRLVVLIDRLFPESVTLFEATLHDANPQEDLHVMLATPGGDGETALRLVHQARSRCRELTVIVPDQAKSAGTLFALGADRIYMGPTSDLGPVDPQFVLPNGGLVAAKAIIAAVEHAEQRVAENPNTYELHASLLSDISATMVQQARDALGRSESLLKAVLRCVASRRDSDIEHLFGELKGPLIGDAQSHGAVISGETAKGFGLPVDLADPADPRWKAVWRLWTRYVALRPSRVYESQRESYIDTNGRHR